LGEEGRMHDVCQHGGPIADRTSVPVWVAELAVLLKRRRRIESQRPPRPHRAQAR
jgi:hypothetical protein